MDWVPETVRALTAMLHEGGPSGVLTFCFALASFGCAIIVALAIWKHLGAILELGNKFVTARSVSDDKIITNLREISDSAKKTESSNQQILERVNNLPSDAPICRARTGEELRAIIREELGFGLTEKEMQVLMKHRQDCRPKEAT